MDAKFAEIDFGSKAYRDALALRQKVLRTPLGRALDSDDLDGESEQRHFALFDKCGDIAATISVKKVDESCCKLRQMAVRDVDRNQGLGTLLLAKVETILQRKGFEYVELHARQSVKRFYELNSYEACSDVFIEIGIAHIKMKKSLI